MTQLLTDDVLVRGDEQLLVTVVIVVLVLNLFQSGMRFAQSMLIGHFGQRMQLQLILEFGSKLLRLPMTYFDGHRSGEVVSRLQDISRINALISEVIFGLPSQTFVAIVSLLVMTLYSLPLTLMALAAFSVVILLNVFFIPVLRQKLRSLIVQGTENQGFLVETFRGALTLKTGNATPQAWEEYQKNFGRITNLRWSAMKLGLYRAVSLQFSIGVVEQSYRALLRTACRCQWPGGSVYLRQNPSRSVWQKGEPSRAAGRHQTYAAWIWRSRAVCTRPDESYSGV